MEVYVVFSQWRRTGWFGRSSWGPKELVGVYADQAKARELVDDLNDSVFSRYTVEPKFLLWGHLLHKETALEILSDYGKLLLGIVA